MNDTPTIIDAEFTEIISDKVDAITDKIVDEMQVPTTFDAPVVATPEVKVSRKDRRAQEAWDRRAPSRLLKQKKQAMLRKHREDVAARVKRQVEASHARAVARKEVKTTV